MNPSYINRKLLIEKFNFGISQKLNQGKNRSKRRSKRKSKRSKRDKEGHRKEASNKYEK